MSLEAEVQELIDAAIQLFDAVSTIKATADQSVTTATLQANLAAESAEIAAQSQQDIRDNWQAKLNAAAEAASSASVSALSLTEAARVLPTADTLRDFDPARATAVLIRGCKFDRDGGEGFWWWDETSTATDNTGTVIQPNGHSGNGRWRRIHGPVVQADWFGPDKTRTTDAYPQIQAAINYALSAELTEIV